MHLNALYDLGRRIYIDALIQPGRQMEEDRPFVTWWTGTKQKKQSLLLTGTMKATIYLHMWKKGNVLQKEFRSKDSLLHFISGNHFPILRKTHNPKQF